MNRVGFKGFTKPAEISQELVAQKSKTMALENLFVVWTGNPYKARRQSARSNSLRTISEKMTPVPVSELLKRAATCMGTTGFSPDVVRAGLFLHQGAKPAVYLAVEKREDGAFVAAASAPFADGFANGLKKGDVVISAAQKKIDAPKQKALTHKK